MTSDDHPNLDTIKAPKKKKRGMKGNALKRQNKSAVTSTPAKKVLKLYARLSKEGVAQFVINNNIRTEAELISEAKKREQAGEPDL